MTVILFISTIIVFLTIDHFVRRNKTAAAVAPLQKAAPVRIPAGIFFSKNHTWLSLFPSGKVQLGVDDFVARLFGTPAVTLLKNDHDTVRKGDPILRLNEGKNELVLRSPIDGTVEIANHRLSQQPELLNESLFVDGWAYTITPVSTNDLRSFFLGTETRTWLRQETGRLRDFFAELTAAPGLAPAMLQDGGLPADGVMNALTPEQCHNFQERFLTVE